MFQNLPGSPGYLAPFPITACPTLVKFFSSYLEQLWVCLWEGMAKKKGPRKCWQEASGFLHGSHDEKHKLILLPKFVILWLGLPERVSLWQVWQGFLSHRRGGGGGGDDIPKADPSGVKDHSSTMCRPSTFPGKITEERERERERESFGHSKTWAHAWKEDLFKRKYTWQWKMMMKGKKLYAFLLLRKV